MKLSMFNTSGEITRIDLLTGQDRIINLLQSAKGNVTLSSSDPECIRFSYNSHYYNNLTIVLGYGNYEIFNDGSFLDFNSKNIKYTMTDNYLGQGCTSTLKAVYEYELSIDSYEHEVELNVAKVDLNVSYKLPDCDYQLKDVFHKIAGIPPNFNINLEAHQKLNNEKESM